VLLAATRNHANRRRRGNMSSTRNVTILVTQWLGK
jgi:hypothetical protein